MSTALVPRFMITCILAISTVVLSDEPKSDKAKQSFEKHGISLKKANEAYWKAIITADKALLGDLEVAAKIAERNKDDAEMKSLRLTIEELQARLNKQNELLKEAAPAATPRAFSFNRPTYRQKINIGMTKDDFLAFVRAEDLSFRRYIATEDLEGGKVLKRERWSSGFWYPGLPSEVYLENGIIVRIEK